MYSHKPDVCTGKSIAAFTVAELGVMLPFCFVSHQTVVNNEGVRFDGGIAGYRCTNKLYSLKVEDLVSIFGKTEAEARAKTLIYLLENKKITVNSLKA